MEEKPANPPNQTIYINNLNEKVKLPELRKALKAIFKQFGEIVDIVALTNVKARGQAFVVFKDIGSAKDALTKMQGFPFCDKPMRIAYAKGKSDALAKLDGTYVERPGKRKTVDGAERKVKRPSGVPTQSYIARAATTAAHPALPNKILFLENLPVDVDQNQVAMVFQQYLGYREVRLVAGRPGLGFVEFDTEVQSAAAMEGLQGFKVDEDHPVKISFAKR